MPNANRDKGLRAERDIAAYFREHGVVTAERRVATGWRSATRQLSDEGDHRGIPGICVQSKDNTKTGPLTDQRLEKALVETRAQCEAVGSVIPLLIEKRRQCADVGKWYAWLPANIHAGLVCGASSIDLSMIGRSRAASYPIRVEMRYIIDDLVRLSNLCAERLAG